MLGFDWSVGFLLGAIISPPDVVAALGVARRLGLPRRLVVILEGEGLANDATALMLYRFAIAAVSTGTFSLEQASGSFIAIVVGELIYGLAIGWLSLRLRHWSHDPRVEITLSLLTPYVAFWLPSHLGGSGVLATVACGLYVSWVGPRLISSATRLQGIFFWDLIVYLIEGLVFLLTGLEARDILIEQSHVFNFRELLIATALTTVIAIAARFVWVFPATYVPRLAKSEAAQARPDAAVAEPIFPFLHRRARRGFARGGAGHSLHHRQRRTVSRTATSSCSSLSASSSSLSSDKACCYRRSCAGSA